MKDCLIKKNHSESLENIRFIFSTQLQLLYFDHHKKFILNLSNLIFQKKKMTATNIYWITGFLVLLLTLHFLYPLIFKYIDDKPMGHQSIFDLALKDHFKISRFNGTIYCLVAISSRIDPMATLMTDSEFLAILVSSLYDFAFAFGCISTGLYLLLKTRSF